MSTAVATVRAHPDKYQKDFNTVVNFLTQCIYNKAPTPSVKVHLSLRPDLPRGRRPALVVAISEERLSFKSTPVKSKLNVGGAMKTVT